MDDEGRRFEDTMDALEAEREQIEGRFRGLLETLSCRLDDVRAAIADTEVRRRAQIEARREALAAADPIDERGGGATTWPQAGGGGRGRANRFARWLMRDFLAVLDRREARLLRRIDAVKLRVDRVQGTVEADEKLADAIEATFARAHEALHAALEAQAEMLALVNAKDAEVLQRAIAGPMRRMEILFDEFGRQQEALLSQLIGRRAELDELVRRVSPAPDDEM